MAKDPAFLFYSSDFLTGTMTMTNEQVGKYVRLLCLQHQKGTLSEKDMLFICGGFDADIFSKFEKKDDNFLNKRLADEMEKRKKHSENQRENVKKRWEKKDTTVLPNSYGGITEVIPLENVIENVIENKKKNRNNNKITELPYNSDDFIKLWNLLINEPKWKKKTATALQASLHKLSKVSERDACRMMEDAIAGGWQGVFEPKNTNQNEKRKRDSDFAAAADAAVAHIFGDGSINQH